MKLLKAKEVSIVTNQGVSTIWENSKNGTFPKPVKIGPRSTRWIAEEVEQWIREKIEAGRA